MEYRAVLDHVITELHITLRCHDNIMDIAKMVTITSYLNAINIEESAHQ